MSLRNYRRARGLTYESCPLEALIMAAMLGSNGSNLSKLQAAFPEIKAELALRFKARGGLLEGDPEYAEAMKR